MKLLSSAWAVAGVIQAPTRATAGTQPAASGAVKRATQLMLAMLRRAPGISDDRSRWQDREVLPAAARQLLASAATERRWT
ncbi:hypothetical protein MSEN_14030 [Mycolicibacter senuensis]|uniref:Uncharacterized protein n=1 Tax=Mycolicibacter senuensis TaxID=386913 RepID=A0A7I9XI84_9MYCO|nr:hypothetical protein MSEN_14030 [Mycolicibacter senuensis]